MIGLDERIAAPETGRDGPGVVRWVRPLRLWLTRRYGPIAPHGAVTVALYLLFTLLAHVISFGRVERSPALYIMIFTVSALFLVMIALFMRVLWVALRETSGLATPGGWRPILLTALLAGIALLTVPRLFSKDVLSYLVYGRTFGAYGLNPYTSNPINVQFDFNFRLIDWHYAASVYGPVWTLLCTALYKILAPLATTHVWGYITGFRALGLAFHLGNAALIWTILGRVRPRDQVAGTIFYAWNPLALIEFAGNGHNDVALVFFLLAAVAAQVAPRRRPALVALFLALSVLTKFITLLIIPAWLVLLWHQAGPGLRARALAFARAGAAGLAACAILWAPFAAALRHPLFLISSSAASAYDNSLLELLYWSLRHAFSAVLPPARSNEVANLLVKTVGRVAFVAVWGVFTWRSRDTCTWLAGSFWILFAYLVLATPWFWPWYVTWLVGLAPIVGGRRATAATFTFSGSVLVIYLLWGNQLPFDRGSVYPIHNVVAFGLPLLVLWLQLRRHGAADQPVYAPAPTDRPGQAAAAGGGAG